ncbi:12043_t:CDS:2, partial [Acaulospora colombiana]
ILHQIQQSAVTANRNLNLTKAQIASKERERRILQLTIKEVSSLESDVNVYRGVGKMFLHIPKPEMEKDLKKQEKDLSDDLDSLAKKMERDLQSKYLEKEFNEAQGQLRDIVIPRLHTSLVEELPSYIGHHNPLSHTHYSVESRIEYRLSTIQHTINKRSKGWRMERDSAIRIGGKAAALDPITRRILEMLASAPKRSFSMYPQRRTRQTPQFSKGPMDKMSVRVMIGGSHTPLSEQETPILVRTWIGWSPANRKQTFRIADLFARANQRTDQDLTFDLSDSLVPRANQSMRLIGERGRQSPNNEFGFIAYTLWGVIKDIEDTAYGGHCDFI